MKKLGLGICSLSFVSPMFALAQVTGIPADSLRPNVVLIYADDLGFGDLECYGAKGVKTPNANKLAANGLCFTNAHSVASTSTPSRYSLLTGEYPWRKQGTDVAAGNAAMIVSPQQYTVADVFKESGYATAAFGKWHLGLGAETGKQDWNGEREDPHAFRHMSVEEKNAYIKENPAYGKIVCRCEMISEGEMIDAIDELLIKLQKARRCRHG